MRFERETNQIDQEGNFIFENKRVDDASDPWLESLEDENGGMITMKVKYAHLG